MNWLVIGILTVCVLYSYKRTRNIVHPSVIVSMIWTLLLFLYNVSEHGLYILSDRFYLATLLWVIPFCLSSLIKFRSKCVNIKNGSCSVCSKKIKILLNVMIVVNLYYLYRLYNFSSLGYYNDYFKLKADGELPVFFTVMNYVNQISLVVFTVICLNIERIKKWKIYLFSLIFFACCFLMSIKTMLAQVIFIIIITNYYKGKLNWKKTVIVFAVFFSLVVSVQVYRSNNSNEFDLIQFLNVYALSPLPAFDLALNGKINLEEGGTYRFFLTFLNKLFGFDFAVYSGGDRWVEVPVPTNVYTVMSDPFVDFGYIGIFVFAVIEGLFWGFLYKRGVQQNKIQWKIFYAVYFYTLIFQFFADYIFTFFSVLLQLLIVIYFLFYKRSIYENRHSNGYLQRC